MNKSIITFFILVLAIFIKLAHAESMNYKHVPYEQNWCGMCHQTDSNGKAISDKFTGTQPDMCYQCHENKSAGSVVHPAVLMGDCTSMCHNPHESSYRPLLKDKIANICTTCHSAPGLDEEVRHSAVDMVKSCIRCHDPHSSEQPKLLRNETSKLCIYCHKDIGKGFEDKANRIHPAMQMGCQACHQPHGGPNSKLAVKPLNELCFNCHNSAKFVGGHPIKGHPNSLPSDPLFPEKPFTCISCHKPHYSKNENLLRYRFQKGDGPYDGTICSVCHWKTMLPPPAPPHPKWNE